MATTIADMAVKLSANTEQYTTALATARKHASDTAGAIAGANKAMGDKSGYSKWLSQANADLGKRSEMGKTLKLLAGGGAIGGFAMAAGEVKKVSDAMVELRNGTKKWSDVLTEIPIFGAGWAIGKNIRELITAEQQITEQYKERVKLAAETHKHLMDVSKFIQEDRRAAAKEQEYWDRKREKLNASPEEKAILDAANAYADNMKAIDEKFKKRLSAYDAWSTNEANSNEAWAKKQAATYLNMGKPGKLFTPAEKETAYQAAQAAIADANESARNRAQWRKEIDDQKARDIAGANNRGGRDWFDAIRAKQSADIIKSAEGLSDSLSSVFGGSVDAVESFANALAEGAKEQRKLRTQQDKADTRDFTKAAETWDKLPKPMDLKSPDLIMRGSAADARVTYQSSSQYKQMRSDINAKLLAEQKNATVELKGIRRAVEYQPAVVTI